MGSPAFAVPSLLALSQHPDLLRVVGVFTQPDKPAGRGRRLRPSAVKEAALTLGLAVHQPTKMKPAATRELLASMAPDVVVVAAYGRILPKSLLGVPPKGCINVHASLLPRHRGASPIAHAILRGDRTTGICIMRLDEGMDTGPVFSRREVAIGLKDTCGTLTDKLAPIGAELLVETLPSILSDDLSAQPQDDSEATMAPLLSKNAGELDFERPAVELERQVRAYNPWPGSFTYQGDVRIQVLAAHVGEACGPPGVLQSADKTGLCIACGRDGLVVEELKPAGKKAMAAASFVAGHGIAAGDRLGCARALP